jgi:hypothetical protein
MTNPHKIDLTGDELRDFWKAVFLSVLRQETFGSAVSAADGAVTELLVRIPGYQPRPDVTAPASGRRDL